MKLNYKEFSGTSKVPQFPVYLIHGSPKHLQNEVERKIQNHYKKSDFSGKKNLVVDTDFVLDELKNEIELTSLFKENRVITLNIVSNSIPQKVKDVFLDSKIPDDLKIIIKLDKQLPSFKKTNFYEYFLKSYCIIEIFELTGHDLKKWVEQKFAMFDLKYNDEIFNKIIEKTEGNTLAIIQELYKMSLAGVSNPNSYFDILQNDYRFSEFDLVNTLLDRDLSKSLKILNYLETVNFPSTYILFLLNSEFKKIYNLNTGNKLNIYIPNFKLKTYNYLLDKINTNTLSTLIEYCHSIDRSIKTGIENISLWHQLEILISCFILNKPVEEFIGKQAC